MNSILQQKKFKAKGTSTQTVYTINPSNEIARGGEGWICTVDENPFKVAKIYHEYIQTRLSESKLKELSALDKKLFVTPEEVLIDSKGDVVGFIMPYVDINGYYPVERIYKRVFCKKEGITDKTKASIVKALIEGVKQAHKNNIVIGDLNPYNVLANKKGEVKFIDVDSYQTPSAKHTGILLEDITDYLYNRKVSKESDYFALSCIVFNLTTLVHPFKGIHGKYKSIKERMTNKLPLFKKGENVKIPKFYQPLKDQHLMKQFEDFYLNGKRSLLTLEAGVSYIATSNLAKPDQVKEFQEGDLLIKNLLSDSLIYDLVALQNRILVKSQTGYKVYDASNVGRLTIKQIIQKSKYDDVYLGEKNLIGKRGSKLFLISNDGSEKEIGNFTIDLRSDIVRQVDSQIFVLKGEFIYQLKIDEVYATNITLDRFEISPKSVNMIGGMFHAAGGRQMLMNVTKGGHLNFTMAPVQVMEVLQNGNLGIVKYQNEKGKVRMRYYKIENMEMKLSETYCGDMYNFGVKDNFVFQPQDGFLRVIRTQDFEEVAEMKCSVCSQQSFVSLCSAGVLVWEGGEVYLINKK